MSAFDSITVVLFGHPDPDVASKIRVPGAPSIEPDGFRVGAYVDDRALAAVLADMRPHVIFTFGDITRYPLLHASPMDVRRRWIHHDVPPEPSDLANQVMGAFVDVATRDRFPQLPLVSVFTPTYRTGERLARPLNSLLSQTYSNWEWVIYDDSPDDETFKLLSNIASREPRVRVFRSDRNCGVIGEVKRRLCGLARGTILVELDHDDELTDHCLADLVEAFAAFPDAGFAYTDCAEVFEENGESRMYGPGWAFGFGSYRDEVYRGKSFKVSNYPAINAKTIRHIVGVPNHVRAWKRDAYMAAGGHGSEIHVCDDYELILRTFLTTRIVHVQRFGYIQYITQGANTHQVRNKEIQRLVRLFRDRYAPEVHARIESLGFEDFMWRSGGVDWNAPVPDPTPQFNYVYR